MLWPAIRVIEKEFHDCGAHKEKALSLPADPQNPAAPARGPQGQGGADCLIWKKEGP